MVTPKGANYLTVAGERPEANTEIDVSGWETVPSLVSQGLLAEIPEVLNTPPSLPEDVPHKDVLESAGYGSLEAVHFLTDQQLIDLPEIGEAAVKVIRAYIASKRGEEVLVRSALHLSDVLNSNEVELVLIARGEKEIPYLPAGEGREDGIVVGEALKNVVIALGQANFLELHLSSDEISLVRLARPDTDVDSILLGMLKQDGTYTLSEPLSVLLERLGLTYPPPAPTAAADGDVPLPPGEQHPTSDPETEAPTAQQNAVVETDQAKGEEVKTEGKAPSSKGKTTPKKG